MPSTQSWPQPPREEQHSPPAPIVPGSKMKRKAIHGSSRATSLPGQGARRLVTLPSRRRIVAPARPAVSETSTEATKASKKSAEPEHPHDEEVRHPHDQGIATNAAHGEHSAPSMATSSDAHDTTNDTPSPSSPVCENRTEPRREKDEASNQKAIWFLRVLVRYLQKKNRFLHERAKAIVMDCTARKKNGEPGYENATELIGARLRALMGEKDWMLARSYFERFLREREQPTAGPPPPPQQQQDGFVSVRPTNHDHVVFRLHRNKQWLAEVLPRRDAYQNRRGPQSADQRTAIAREAVDAFVRVSRTSGTRILDMDRSTGRWCLAPEVSIVEKAKRDLEDTALPFAVSEREEQATVEAYWMRKLAGKDPTAPELFQKLPKELIREGILPFLGATPAGMIRAPREADVLLGRGGFGRRHLGNQTYQKVVLEHQSAYRACKDAASKSRIAKKVVREIRFEHGGRFLQKEAGTGKWERVGDESKILQRVKQALRDKKPRPQRRSQIAQAQSRTAAGPSAHSQ